MARNRAYTEVTVSQAVMLAIDDTAMDDEQVSNFNDAAVAVITGQMTARTASQNYGVNLEQLEVLIQMAKKKLEKQGQNIDNNLLLNGLEQEEEEEETVEKKQQMDRKGQKIGKVIQKEKENEVKQSRKRKADDKKTEKEGAKPSAEKPVKRRRRRKGEELLVEEANELVLKGKELDSDALALVLSNNDEQEVVADSVENVIQSPATGTRSRRSLLVADGKQQRALTWKAQHNDSMALVPFRQKQNGPRRSQGRTSLTTPKTPNSNSGHEKHTVNTDSAGRVIISHNKRWTEYPKITEELLDEVLGAMSNRNEEDQARKTAMRAAILEVLYVQTSIISAAQRHQLGLSTTRRYCRDIKLRLENFLGEAFVDNAFLRQFQKYKERVTLDHYKEALQRAGKRVPADLEGAKKQQKRTSGPIGSPVERDDNPQASKRILEQHRGTNNAGGGGPSSARPVKSSSSVGGLHFHGLDGRNQKTGTLKMITNAPQQQQNSSQIGVVSLLKPHQSPVLLTSRAVRQPLLGTPAELRRLIQKFFAGKYKGNPEDLASLLTKLLVYDARMKRECTGCPMGVLRSAYNLLGRFYEVENVQVVEENLPEEWTQ